MLKLVIQDDEGKTTVVPLIRDEITIGRKEGNTIRLTERNVSRRHAKLLRQNGAVQIEDLDSYNGIRINGARIQGRVPVTSSDRIQIGDYQLELKKEEQAGATATAAVAEPDIAQQATAITARPTAERPNASPIPASGPVPTPVAAVAAAAGAVPELPARLVVVSANMAGREFLLSQPTSVIGRTEDNDIVVNHRSISRHHAKIVHEQGRFAIVDLQSSNGVRVNGEEYGKVELRRGDMIDLGHVRYRFVEPGEDFIFERDATIVHLGGAGKSKNIMIGAAVGVVLLAVVLILALSGGDDQPVVTPGPDVDTPNHPNVPDPTHVGPAGVEGLLIKARAAAQQERWEDELVAARQALDKGPKNQEALRLKSQASDELANRDRYETFSAELARGDARKIVDAYRKISSRSVYKIKATESYETFRDEYMQDTEEELRTLLAQEKCGPAKMVVRDAQALFPDQDDSFKTLLAECRSSSPSSDGDSPRKPPRQIDIASTIKEAKAALQARKSSVALRKAEQVLRQEPNNFDALMVGALAACDLKKSSKAARFAKKLPPARMNYIRQRCATAGDPLK